MGLLLTLVSGICYFYSFPPYASGYSAFICLAPFFLALSKADTLKKAAFYGFTWGLVLSVLLSVPLYIALITEYELSIFFSTMLIIFTVYIPYGVIYAIFGILYKYFFKSSGIFIPLITASLWLLIDYIMGTTPFFMPWAFTGYSQVFTIFIQLCDLTGIYGVTFLIILTNSSIMLLFYYKKERFKFLLIPVISILLLSAIYGTVSKNRIEKLYTDTDTAQRTATVIQGNFSSKEKWDSKNTSAVINTYINMTRQIIDSTDIIVWPETVLNSNDNQNINFISGIASQLKEDQLFITGATRTGKNNMVYNTIFTSDNSGLKYIYDKKILFPFTETSLAGLSSGNFMDSPSIFSTGKAKPVFRTSISDIGYSICFELIYPDYIRKIKNGGAAVLINVANDSWFGNTYEPYMHMYSGIARAVENRFHVIRASNSGISAVISPAGEIITSAGVNQREKITASIKIFSITSFYSKFGDLIVIFSALVIITALILMLKKQD